MPSFLLYRSDGLHGTSGGHHGGLTDTTGRHGDSTLPGGAAAYGADDANRGPGAYDTLGESGRRDAYGDGNNASGHGGVLGDRRDGHEGRHGEHGSSDKGFLGRKKDDLEDSLSREQKAKAELDAAMAKHNEARSHADKQLSERENAAQAESVSLPLRGL